MENRIQTGDIYSKEIEDNIAKVNSYLKNSEDKSDFKKYSYLKAASIIAKMNQALIEKLQIISSHQVDFLEINYDINSLVEKTNTAAQKLNFRISIDNDSDKKITKVIEEVLSKKGFSISDSGDYSIDGKVEFTRIDLQRKQKFVRWELNLEMRDSSQNIIFSFNKKNREGHLNYPEAEARSIRTVEKIIRKNLAQEIDNYVSSLLK